MQTTINANANNTTIHANISPEMKQSVKDWCQRHDLSESQMVRRGLNLILTNEKEAAQ